MQRAKDNQYEKCYLFQIRIDFLCAGGNNVDCRLRSECTRGNGISKVRKPGCLARN